MGPTLSLVIPAHNEAFEIQRTLDCVFQAARSAGSPFEIIVVNDASTDRTVELARAAAILGVNLSTLYRWQRAGAT